MESHSEIVFKNRESRRLLGTSERETLIGGGVLLQDTESRQRRQRQSYYCDVENKYGPKLSKLDEF